MLEHLSEAVELLDVRVPPDTDPEIEELCCLLGDTLPRFLGQLRAGILAGAAA